jgi:hypothetical protein
MKKICIVANNPRVCSIPDEYDFYVHFNWANNFALTPSKKNIMAMRYNSLAEKLGSMRWHDYCKYGKQTIAIGIPSFIRKIDSKIEIIDTTKMPSPPGKDPYPTSGFAAIHYYLNKEYDVTICGFDIEKAIYYHKSRHPLDWEKEQIAKMISEGTIKSI